MQKDSRQLSTSRPRVCLISHVYLEKMNRGKLPHLGRSVDLTVISPDEFPSAYGMDRADFSEARNYRVKVYPCRFRAGVRTSTRWTLASRDLGFRESRPDMIHVENEAHSFSLLQALICRRRYAPRAKVVVSLWANQRLTGGKGLVLNRLARLTRPGVDLYIGGNSEAKTLLVESGVPPERVVVLPLVGVDVDYYGLPSNQERMRLRREMDLALDEFVIGFVGRFVEDKGIPDLLQAYHAFREQATGRRPRLLCVGDGPLKPKLLGHGPDVLVASPGGGGAVLPYYHVMDALVLPSRTMPHWKEQFGLVLAEAMACGVPVVGSDSGAIPEVIGDAGLVFHEGDVRALVGLLHRLTNPDARADLAERARKRVIADYSAERIAQRTISVYRQVLSE